MIYFTADLHFYHGNVIKHAKRPFADAAEMNRALIRNWNQTVSTEDEVYILGDVTMKGAGYAMEALTQLHGRKYLVKGNHDGFAEQASFDLSIFKWIKDYHELKYQNELFMLFHYPIQEWNGLHRGAYHLHGHQHNHADYNEANRAQGLRCYDIGVDANRYLPVGIHDLMAYFEA